MTNTAEEVNGFKADMSANEPALGLPPAQPTSLFDQAFGNYVEKMHSSSSEDEVCLL